MLLQIIELTRFGAEFCTELDKIKNLYGIYITAGTGRSLLLYYEDKSQKYQEV